MYILETVCQERNFQTVGDFVEKFLVKKLKAVLEQEDSNFKISSLKCVCKKKIQGRESFKCLLQEIEVIYSVECCKLFLSSPFSFNLTTKL